MKPIIKSLNLETIEYHITHLSIINCLLPVKMTNKEIETLAHFMSFDGTLADLERFGKTARKIVRQKMGLTHQGLSNYIVSLTKKKFIVEHDKVLTILPILHPDKTEQSYMIKLKNLG